MVVVAYLVNQYPAPSHTFIRREIAALEAIGHTVHRFTHRSSAAPLVDPLDLAEQSSTDVLSMASPLRVAIAVLRLLTRHPVRFARMLSLAARVALRSGPAGFGKHIGYVGLACLLADRARSSFIKPAC